MKHFSQKKLSCLPLWNLSKQRMLNCRLLVEILKWCTLILDIKTPKTGKNPPLPSIIVWFVALVWLAKLLCKLCPFYEFLELLNSKDRWTGDLSPVNGFSSLWDLHFLFTEQQITHTKVFLSYPVPAFSRYMSLFPHALLQIT